MIIKYEFDGNIIHSIHSDKQACQYAHDEKYSIVNKLTWFDDDSFYEKYEADDVKKIYEYKQSDVNFDDCINGKYDFYIEETGFGHFVIKSKDTNEIIDDAKGNGYLTAEKAFNGYKFKCCRGFVDPDKNYIFKEVMTIDDLINKGKSFKEINNVYKTKESNER